MNKAMLRLFWVWSWCSSLILVGTVGSIIGFLFYKGWPILNLHLIFGQTNVLDAVLFKQQVFDGLFSAIVGTLLLVITAVSLALPVGLATGIYLSEYSRGPVKLILTLLFEILAGIPSIVVGLFGFSMALFLHKHLSPLIYPSLLIAAFSLSFLVLPYLIRSTQTALASLPHNLRIIAPALGASKLQNIILVLIPRALNGIVSGVILSIGRCAEDTAVIMLTGAVAMAGVPNSLMDKFEALPFYIYYISSQYMDQQELLKGYGAAIVLLGICTALLVLSLVIKTVMGRTMAGRL